MCPASMKQHSWLRALMTETRKMAELPELANRILAGSVRGRVVIEIA